MSERLHKQIETEIVQFIWGGKKLKIPLRTLQAPKTEGGLGLVNLRKKEQALKISWINILNTDLKCQELANTFMQHPMETDVFRCNMAPEDAEWMVNKNNSLFWSDVFKAWCKLNYCVNLKTGQDQVIWGNSRIRIDNKPVFLEKCYSKGLKWITQLYPNGKLIGVKQAAEQFNLDLMSLNSIISAIPSDWRRDLQRRTRSDKTTLYDELSSSKRIVREAYRLIGDKPNLAKTAETWSTHLGADITPENIVTQCRRINSITNVTKLRSFQYRLLHRAIILNANLYHWRMRDDNLCTWCEQAKEDALHFFCMCPVVTEWWGENQSPDTRIYYR